MAHLLHTRLFQRVTGCVLFCIFVCSVQSSGERLFTYWEGEPVARMPPRSRFMAVAPADEQRRYQREWQRVSRSAGVAREEDGRPGSRHKKYPCCFKRRDQCTCDWQPVEKHIKRNEMDAFLSCVSKAALLKIEDTADVGPILHTLAGTKDINLQWFARVS